MTVTYHLFIQTSLFHRWKPTKKIRDCWESQTRCLSSSISYRLITEVRNVCTKRPSKKRPKSTFFFLNRWWRIMKPKHLQTYWIQHKINPKKVVTWIIIQLAVSNGHFYKNIIDINHEFMNVYECITLHLLFSRVYFTYINPSCPRWSQAPVRRGVMSAVPNGHEGEEHLGRVCRMALIQPPMSTLWSYWAYKLNTKMTTKSKMVI